LCRTPLQVFFSGCFLPLLLPAQHDNAPSASMGADAERARRLQERRSLSCWR
jgi:hypothetical protein